MGKFLIYGLVDPRDGQLRYVGKTEKSLEERLRGHLYEARRQRNTHRYTWLRSLLASGFEPEILLLEKLEPGQDWQEAERHHITYWRFLGADLVNGTDGGEGQSSGYRPTQETRQKMSAALMGHPGWGGSPSEETRLKISKTLSGKPKPVGFGEAISRTKARRAVIDEHGRVYRSRGHAARELGLSSGNIWAVLSGKGKSTGGHTFRYLEA